MSTNRLNELIHQAEPLTPLEKQFLAQFLLEQCAGHVSIQAKPKAEVPFDRAVIAQKQVQEQQWLDQHGGGYAGQWVALDGDRLVGSGSSPREAALMAHQAGAPHPCVVYIEGVDELPFGGW